MSNPKGQQVGPRIVWGHLDSLKVYNISESELDTLAAGFGDSVHLTFCVASISFGIAFTITLFTTTIADPVTHAVFVALAVAFFVLGAFFAFSAYRQYIPKAKLVREIRGRIREDENLGVQASVAPGSEKLIDV